MSIKVIIDADILLYGCGFAVDSDHRARMAGLLSTPPVSYVMQAIKYKVSSIVGSIQSRTLSKVDEIPILVVSPTGATFRHRVAKAKEYKGNRNQVKPSNFAESKAKLLENPATICVDDLEGDDVCGILLTKEKGNAILATLDKDLNMIPGWHYNWNRQTLEYINHTQAYRNFCYQLLTGDSVDNIPGCVGIGPVKAKKILEGTRDKAEMLRRVVSTYKSKGHTKDYFIEQATLVWIMRKEGEVFDGEKVENQILECWN